MPKTEPTPKPARPKTPPKAPGRAGGARTPRPTGRARMNLMVDRALLERAAASVGTTNMSDAVDEALRRLAEDDAIVAGIDAMFGAYPDVPRDDAP